MPFLYGITTGNYGDEKVKSTSPFGNNPLGTVMILPDGRLFVMALAAGTIGVGKLAQQEVTSTTYDADIAVQAAWAAGAKSGVLTNAGAPLVVDTYLDGTMRVNDQAGEGFQYRIQKHDVATTTEDFTVFLHPDDPIITALTTSSQVGLRKTPYDDVIIWPASSGTGICLGVTCIDVVSGDYFWAQVYGSATILSDAVVLAAGQPVVPSFSVAGACRRAYTAAGIFTTSGSKHIIGWAEDISASGEYGKVFLTLGAL